jgi:hypothetical protein
MKKNSLLLLAIWISLNSCLNSEKSVVEQFGIFEVSIEFANQYKNPFIELKADAEITRPDGSVWTIPLFWDGGQTCKLRISPDLEGDWSYKITSTDQGLNGKSESFSCNSSEKKGSIQPMDKFPHHFQCQNGEKMWFMGETAWALFTDDQEEKHDRQAVEYYLKTRASQGFNVVHSMMLSEAGLGNSGGLPFIDMENQIINPDYWKEIDERVEFANQQGLVVGLFIAWGDKRKQEPFAWRLFPDIEARKNYARYIAARYSAFDVYFIISGEWHGEVRTRPSTEDEMKKEFIEIGNAFREAEPHGRMMGIHPMGSDGSVREFHVADWMDFGDYQQNYRDLHNRILESRKYNLPIVNSEYGYHLRDMDGDGIPDKDNSTSIESMRNASWDIVMAGGYLVTGFGTTYFGGYRDPGPFNVDASRNKEWEMQINLIKEFFTEIEWWKLEPHDELLKSATSRGKDTIQLGRVAPPSTTYWLLAEQGKQYIIYCRGLTDPLILQTGTDNAETYRSQLFNPRTGEFAPFTNEQEIKNNFTWTPPDENDWILYLYKII